MDQTHHLASNRSRVAVILAGGQSRRFGRDKMWESFNGIPLIKTVIRNLRLADFDIVISGQKNKFSSLSYPVIEDDTPFAGPLWALDSIWKQIGASKIFLLAGDMPFIQKPVIEFLWKKSKNSDLTLLKNTKGVSPIPGVYSRRTHGMAKKLIQEGRRDLKSLLNVNLKVSVIPHKSLNEFDHSQMALTNINTVRDLEAVAFFNWDKKVS